MIVEGYEDEINRIGSTLSGHNIDNWKTFDAEAPKGAVPTTPTNSVAPANPVVENEVDVVNRKEVVDRKTLADRSEVIIVDNRDNTIR